LKLNDYQELAKRTMPPSEWREQFLEAGIGVSEEAGEILSLVKKEAFHGHTYPAEKYADELGDLLWYLAFLATLKGLTLKEVAQQNVEKLKRRYPEGFSTEKSINRRD
jgi:NTP pyrophosphatase (non-canonical NTP hydrolase)